MSLGTAKQCVLIVTTDLEHPTYHRIHYFLPYLSEKFNIILVNIRKKYLTSEEGDSTRLFSDFIKFLTSLVRILSCRARCKDNVFTIEIPSVKGGLLLSLALTPFLIRGLIKRYDIRVVWGLGPVAGYSVLLSRASVPFVYDDSDRHYLFFDNPLMKITMMEIEETCISKADVVTSAGPSLLKSSRKIRGANGAVVFLPNAVDVTKYSNSGGGLTKLYDLIYIGIVDEWCGLHYVLEAAKQLVWQVPNFNLLIVGPIQEGYYKRLKEIVFESGLAQHVRFVGRQNHIEVLRYLGQSRVGVAVYPRTQLMMYAFTIKLLEYMAAGLAVVASNVGDTAEIVRNANCGIIVEPEPEGVADAIIQLMQNPSLQRLYGECGRQYISQNYNIEMISRKLIHLFESLGNTRTNLST